MEAIGCFLTLKIKQPVREILQNSRPATASEILWKNIDDCIYLTAFY